MTNVNAITTFISITFHNEPNNINYKGTTSY